MQPTKQIAWGRQRANLEVVADTLAALTMDGESLAELAHDARNMVTALALYCDLLEEPGVLAESFSALRAGAAPGGCSQPSPG